MLSNIVVGLVSFILMFTLILNLKFPTTQGLFMWGTSFVFCLVFFIACYLYRGKR